MGLTTRKGWNREYLPDGEPAKTLGKTDSSDLLERMHACNPGLWIWGSGVQVPSSTLRLNHLKLPTETSESAAGRRTSGLSYFSQNSFTR